MPKQRNNVRATQRCQWCREPVDLYEEAEESIGG